MSDGCGVNAVGALMDPDGTVDTPSAGAVCTFTNYSWKGHISG